jgi:hypothetical protein
MQILNHADEDYSDKCPSDSSLHKESDISNLEWGLQKSYIDVSERNLEDESYSLFSGSYFAWRSNEVTTPKAARSVPAYQTPESMERKVPLHAPEIMDRKDPLESVYEARPNIPNNSNWAVVKLSPIPWDLTITEVHEFFHPFKVR